MPQILEMREIDGKLAVFLDMPPDEQSPVHLWTEAERLAAIKAEREACAAVAEGYSQVNGTERVVALNIAHMIRNQ